MSRQFDELMEGRFDFYGTEYKLIAPENVTELMQALEVKSALETYISSLVHDEDLSNYDSLLQEQIDYIREYVESLGEFDSSTLANNIVFLVKKYGMRVRELEETIGVSAGYLSRTIKENSKKKISIDIVWKITRLFDTDIKTLTETEMWVAHTNTDLLERFLKRLYEDTRDSFFTWKSEGGVMIVLQDRYKELGLVTEEEDEVAVYHPNHLNQEYKWVLAADIVSLECFDGKKDLAIIPYKIDGKDDIKGFDFIFVWEEEGRWCWGKVFYTSDDPFGLLQDGAQKLYDFIESSEYDVKLSPKVHQLISNYVKGGRSGGNRILEELHVKNYGEYLKRLKENFSGAKQMPSDDEVRFFISRYNLESDWKILIEDVRQDIRLQILNSKTTVDKQKRILSYKEYLIKLKDIFGIPKVMPEDSEIEAFISEFELEKNWGITVKDVFEDLEKFVSGKYDELYMDAIHKLKPSIHKPV